MKSKRAKSRLFLLGFLFAGASFAAPEPELLRSFETELPRELGPDAFPYLFARPLVFPVSGGGERVVVATSEGTVYYLNGATAKKEFKLETLEPVFASPVRTAGADPTIVIASEKGKVYFLDAEARIRKNPQTQLPAVYRVEGKISATPLVSPSGEVLVGTLNGSLYFLNAHAELLERLDLGATISAAPALAKMTSGEDIALVGTEGGSLFVVSLLTRRVLSSFDVGGPVRSAPIATLDAHGKPLWILATRNGRVLALDESGLVLLLLDLPQENGWDLEDLHVSLAKRGDGAVAVASLRTLALLSPDLSVKWWKGETPFFMNPGFHSSGTLVVGSDARGLRFRKAPDLAPLANWPGNPSDYHWVTFGQMTWFFGQEADGRGVMFWFEPRGGELLARAFPHALGAYSEPAELSDGTLVVSRVDGKVLFFRSP